MPRRDLVVIGASAGGLEAVTAILTRLPASLKACLLVAMHTRSNGQGVLPDILGRNCALPVAYASSGDLLAPGRIYVAPADWHLLVAGGALRLGHGPRENGFRPAIDPLFRTAAREHGPRVIGVILSGSLSDGTFGLSVVKHHGGVAIVQDPADAMIASMPLNAMHAVDVDYVLPASEIADAIARLSFDPTEGENHMARNEELEPQLPSEETQVSEMAERYGAPSTLTCPECGGALWEVQEGRVVRYQCHVGHQYGADSLEAAQREVLDGALWSAVRVLEEHAELKMRMARRAEANGFANVSQGFSEGAQDAHAQAQKIRSVLFASSQPVRPPLAEAADSPRRSASPKKARPTASRRRAPGKRKR